MPLQVMEQPLPLRPSEDDVLFVGKTRVPLTTVLGAYLQGESAEEIVNSYPTLDLGDVYTVLGYYLSHRDEVDAYLAEQSLRAARIREDNDARFRSADFRQLLRSRRETRTG